MKDFKYISFGITNQCDDNFFIPFFDYDIVDLPDVVLELKMLQSRFNLSHIYLVSSTNGFNAFSLDKISLKFLGSIYKISNLIDKDFVKWGLNRGFMTLRMGSDKKLVMVLRSVNDVYIQSRPHKRFFIDIMGFRMIESTKTIDMSKHITLTMFPSNKQGFKKELIDY